MLVDEQVGTRRAAYQEAIVTEAFGLRENRLSKRS